MSPRVQHLHSVYLSASRWIYLNDQNLCIPASSSFVYGAVAIGASIYVIGDLDTGKHMVLVFGGACCSPAVVSPGLLLIRQVPVMTMCGSSSAARAPGTTPSRSYHPTFVARAARPCALPTASFSACSCSRASSASGCTRRDRDPGRGRALTEPRTRQPASARYLQGFSTLACKLGLPLAPVVEREHGWLGDHQGRVPVLAGSADPTTWAGK